MANGPKTQHDTWSPWIFPPHLCRRPISGILQRTHLWPLSDLAQVSLLRSVKNHLAHQHHQKILICQDDLLHTEHMDPVIRGFGWCWSERGGGGRRECISLEDEQAFIWKVLRGVVRCVHKGLGELVKRPPIVMVSEHETYYPWT